MLRENDLISLPREVGELQRLRELHIQGNRLTVLPPELGRFNFFLPIPGNDVFFVRQFGLDRQQTGAEVRQQSMGDAYR